MTEIGKKLYKIIESKISKEDLLQYHSRLLGEISLFEDQDGVLEYIHSRVIDNSKGDKNEVNSALVYLLCITTQEPDISKPMQWVKRRTYARAGWPDIDMDFDYLERHRIIEYLHEKYGKEYVANIGTTQSLKTKAAVRRVIKVLDPTGTIQYDANGVRIKTEQNFNFALENTILKTLPGLMKRPDATFVNSVDEAYEEYPEFKQHMDAYPEVMRVAKAIEGRISGFGRHAGGYVISSEPLEKICPLHVTTGGADDDDEGKVIATQFSMEDVESLGLIKFDILGLSTKTAIKWAADLIKERHGIDLDLSKLPLDDKPTLDLLNSGLTDGCFQLEKAGMKQTLQQIGIDSFDDLVVSIAMFRPGPKDYIPEFAARKNGTSSVTYPHPLMKEIVSNTFGIMCFQEQIMKVFMAFAGLTASDGYLFMKGCAKKKPEIIANFKDKFCRGALANNIDQKIVDRVWHDLEKFAGYSFNKSHSVSYAYESFKTAYLKAHYDIEFIASRMSVENVRRKFEEVLKYEQDAKTNRGIQILDIDLNLSKVNYTIVGERQLLRPILVKDVGLKAAHEIVKHQPYKGADILFDFASRVGPAVTSSTVEAMRYEAKLWLGYSQEKLKSDFEQIRKDRKKAGSEPMNDMYG